MNYSIIIPYRNREKHLEIIVPVLRTIMPFAEIVVVEQNDTDKFKKSCLLNIGARVSNGDILIFQDVDYVLNQNLKPSYGYWEPTDVEFDTLAVLPVNSATFTDMELNPLPIDEVPSGYRHFKTGVDDDFFGGAFILSRSLFNRIRGFNPLFEGWGLEDADVRKRLTSLGCGYFRMQGDFLVLPHADNNPGADDPSFANNVSLYQDIHNTCMGSPNLSADIEFVESNLVDKWIKTTNFIVKANDV